MATKSATQMASLYGMKSSVAFNKLLANCGLLIHTIKCSGSHGCAHAHLGLTAVEESPFFLPNGAKASKKRSVWTEKGQEYIHEQLSRLGIVPASEQRDLFTTLNA